MRSVSYDGKSLDAFLSQLETGPAWVSPGVCPAWNRARKERDQPTQGQRPRTPVPHACEIPALLSATAPPCSSASLHQRKEEGARGVSQGGWEEKTGRRPDSAAKE